MNEDIQTLYECCLNLKLHPQQNWLDRQLGIIRLVDPDLGTIFAVKTILEPSQKGYRMSQIYGIVMDFLGNYRIKNQ